MKKILYIVIAVVVVLLVAGGIYLDYQMNHPDSSYDTLPREIREEMMEHWPKEEYGDKFYGNEGIRYYGLHGDCVVFMDRNPNWSEYWTKTYAGYTFYLDWPFSLVVYRAGEFVDLQEAYDRGWINRWQIKSMEEYHKEIWGAYAEPNS